MIITSFLRMHADDLYLILSNFPSPHCLSCECDLCACFSLSLSTNTHINVYMSSYIYTHVYTHIYIYIYIRTCISYVSNENPTDYS